MADKDIVDNSKKALQAKTASRTSFFQRLAASFGFTLKKGQGDKGVFTKEAEVQFMRPPESYQMEGKTPQEQLDIISKLRQVPMSSSIKELFEEWMQDTQNTYANIYEREERNNALIYMCDNEGIVKSSVEYTASEVSSLTDRWAFSVISEDEDWQNAHNALLQDTWKIDKVMVHDIAYNMCLLGEAFQGVEISSAGIVSLNNLKNSDIVERLEFKPAEIANFYAQMSNSGSRTSGFSVNLMNPMAGSFNSSNTGFQQRKNTTYKSTSDLLKDYIENITEVSSNEFFAKHLLGYRVASDELIAPWQIVHYRYNAEVSEFWPYGQPPLLACLAAYKALQRSLGLDDLEKRLNLPITMYKVKTNGATTARAYEIVNEVKEDFENVGLMSTAAGFEGPSLCTNIWTSDDLVTIERVERGGGSGDGATDKAKFFYDRLAGSLYIPRSFLDPSAEGFQMSGVALMAQFKPFRNFVETFRANIQNEIEFLIRLHDSIVGIKTPDFVLNMNVESSIANEELSTRIQLADAIQDFIANLLGVEDKTKLPQTVKKDIMAKYSGLSQTELDTYLKTLEQEGVEQVEVSQEEADAGFGDFSGGGGDEGGGDDFGTDFGGDDGGGEVEEAYIKDKKKRLIESRYKALTESEVRLFLTEKLGSLKTARTTSLFCKESTSNDTIRFLKEHSTYKRGKKPIKG